MPCSSEIRRRSIFLAIAILSALPLIAQKAQETSRPKYDLTTETKMKGTVEEVKLPPTGSAKEITHLLVKAGADVIDVYLCPKSFRLPALSTPDGVALVVAKNESICPLHDLTAQNEFCFALLNS